MIPSREMQGLRQQDLVGIKALLERRCGSATVAEDLLSEAIETSLRKLQAGDIAQPELLVGYVYRVALNHLRNFGRTNKASRSTSEGLEEIPDSSPSDAAMPVDQARWAKLMREVLEELPAGRDRQIIVGFYLEERGKEALCQQLGLSELHFNRVIHRARQRFRELLEARGFKRGDFLSFPLLLVG
jgi:RNA polymerase sigma-70 factor (ECF subfamily)